MKWLSNKSIFTLLAMALVVADAAYLMQSALAGIVPLLFFLFVPGYLITQLWNSTRVRGWVAASFAFGLSLLLMIVGGLAVNTLYFMRVDHPLNPVNIMLFLNAVTVLLLWLGRRQLLHRKLPHFTVDREKAGFVAALTLLPILAILGAIRINNGGSNALTMLAFGLSTVLFMLLLWRKRNVGIYPYAVFSIGLTVLLALSMRSWLVSGHDVRHEYQLFTYVLQYGFWSNSIAPGDAYEACLSVTILPTVISAISHASGACIFKVIMQFIFAFGLVPLYLFAKNFGGSRRALLIALLLIAFPTFVNDMPFLVRQEVAFVFFGLVLLASFAKLRRRLATWLVMAFMVGLTLSHYSSSYVALVIFFGAWAVYFVARKFLRPTKVLHTPLLSLPILTVAFLFTFSWNVQVTATAHGLVNAMVSTVQGMLEGSNARSSGVRYGIVSGKTDTADKVLADYARDKANLVHNVPDQDMPATVLGHIVNAKTLHSFNAAFRGLSAKVLQVLLLLGIAYFLLRKLRVAEQVEVYLYALACASVVLMVLMILLPSLSVDYGLTRLFLQTMIIVGVPIIVGLELILGIFRRFKWPVMVCFVGLFFLHLTGFVPQLLGGYPPQLTLNNSGYYYDIYYRHAGELTAMEALSTRFNDLPVAADKYAISRRPEGMKPLKYVADPVTSTNKWEYLYHDYANVHNQVYANFLQGNVLEYSYNDTLPRNAVYANQDSHIYKRFSITSGENE